jgi:hypothetical protein
MKLIILNLLTLTPLMFYGQAFANISVAQEKAIAKYYANNLHKTKASFENERKDLENKIVKNAAQQVATLNEIGTIVNGIGEQAVPQSMSVRYHDLNCELRVLGVKLATLNYTNPKFRNQASEDFAVTQFKRAFEECAPIGYE